MCLQVWIELKYDFDMNRLDYEFHSFRGIAEEQMDISIAVCSFVLISIIFFAAMEQRRTAVQYCPN